MAPRSDAGPYFGGQVLFRWRSLEKRGETGIGKKVPSDQECSFDHLVAQYYRAIWRTLIELPDVVDQGLFSKIRLSLS